MCDVICVQNCQVAFRIWPAKCFDFDRSALMRHEKEQFSHLSKMYTWKRKKHCG